MAVNEVIRSPFPTQPSARSLKLRIYESLFLLNQGFDHVVALLCGMEKFSIADKESMQSALAEIEEVRAGVNADFVEQLVCLAEHAIGFGATPRRPARLFPSFDARDHAGDVWN